MNYLHAQLLTLYRLTISPIGCDILTYNKKITAFSVALSLGITAALSPPAYAQEAEEQADDGAIVVIGGRIRGGVETSVPVLQEIDAEDVEALGVSSLEELVEAVSPQANSGRSRGGRPIFLINGLRISSRREIRDLPPESVRRVQVFPEEVALQYGFRPDQRVINFILKSNFSSFNAEVEYGQPQSGGFARQEVEATLTRIGQNFRLNIDFEYERGSQLTEAERDIIADDGDIFALDGNITSLTSGAEIDPALSALAGQMVSIVGIPGESTPTLGSFAANPLPADGNIGAFRSLIGSNDRFELNSSWSRTLAPQTTLALNANLELDETRSLLGLPTAELILPASNPASPFANDVVINQSFLNPQPLSRRDVTYTANFGAAFNTLIGPWRWSLTGDYNYIEAETSTTQNADFTSLQAGLNNGSVNPFEADFGSSLSLLAPDISDSTNQLFAIRSSFSGQLFQIPSGPVRLTLGQNYARRSQDSRAVISGIETLGDLSRNSISGTASLEIPVVARDLGPLGFLGEIAVNGNYGIADLSDFGTLQEYGFGLTWSPSGSLTLSATFIADEAAPDISAIGNPIIVTPNRSFFDFTNNQTVLIDNITGGNPLLQAQDSRDWKFSVSWKPNFIKGVTLQSEYFVERSNNVTANFPLLSPEIEAAFPDRVVRDAAGDLISVDQRQVNYDELNSRSLRSGISFRGRIGKGGRGGGRKGGERKGGGSDGSKPSSQAGNKAPSRLRIPGRRPGGRFFLSLFHTWRFQDEILISPGVPLLDRLNGSTRDFLGGTPQHEIEISGGVFHNGMGVRLRGGYRSGTQVLGSGLPGSTDLNFSDRLSINALFFLRLDRKVNLAKKIPAFKNSRIRLRVRNIFNDFVRVTDSNGLRPMRYQRGFVDPEGRYFELNFRKRF